VCRFGDDVERRHGDFAARHQPRLFRVALEKVARQIGAGLRLPGGRVPDGEIAPRVLSRELKTLTRTGLIDRKDFGEVPPKVEYRLTAKGESFVPVIAAIKKWGARHLGEA
jgi:hypothetical protein